MAPLLLEFLGSQGGGRVGESCWDAGVGVRVLGVTNTRSMDSYCPPSRNHASKGGGKGLEGSVYSMALGTSTMMAVETR